MVLYVLESIEMLSGVSSNLHRVLKSLADLFVLYGIAENSGSFLEVRKKSINHLMYYRFPKMWWRVTIQQLLVGDIMSRCNSWNDYYYKRSAGEPYE